LGMGDWANPQSPIPNPQSPTNKIFLFKYILRQMNHNFKFKFK
jgi:hypothetical protein